jgi:imidazolonepropionase-like amidohydrolase
MSLVLAEFVLRPSFAQSPQAGAAVLTGARLIDGTGSRPIEQSALVIVNGRVSSVGPLDSVKIPPGAVRIDVSGKTIIPGLISAHAHANSEAGSALPPRDQLAAQLRLYADYGITTVFLLDSTPADLPHTIALRDEQERIALDRARVYVSGPSVRAASSIEEARQIANSRADAKVDIVKMHIQGNPKDMTPEVYGALIDEAHKRGLRAAAHLFYLKDATGLLAAGVDVVAHSVRATKPPPHFFLTRSSFEALPPTRSR